MSVEKIKSSVKNVLIVLGIMLMIFSVLLIAYRMVKNPPTEEKDSEIPEPSSPEYKVLFLDSYTPTHSSYSSQERGLKEGLYLNNISYDVVYMDTKNYGSVSDVEDFYGFFKKRIESRSIKYDGVIIGDDAALSFVLEHQDEFFSEIPVVFYGINNHELARKAALNPHMTGFSEETYLDSTIEVAMKLMPWADTISAIYDDTPTGRGDRDTFYSFEKSYPSLKFAGISTTDYTRREFEDLLESISSNTILIYMTAFNDSEGINYTIPQSISTIVGHAHVPVFRNYTEGHGKGILGGTMMNFPEQCRMAGETMNSILRGERKVSEIPLNTETSGIVVYDYSLMRKYNMDMSILPEDTVFLNKPVNIFEAFDWLILPMVLSVISVVMVIASLVMGNVMLKSADRTLKFDSEHDRLTQLANRQAAEQFLSGLLETGKTVSMLRIGIDNFKSLNENFGHKTGDDYLIHAAMLLRKFCDARDLYLARCSGDEFIVLCVGEAVGRGDELIKDLHEAFKAPMTIGMEHVVCTVSIGIVNSGEDMTVEKMFQRAAIAMESAKEHGKNTTLVFSGELEEKTVHINRIRQKIVDAIENDGFYMVYQPKVDARTKELVGYEALIRMKDGGIGPAEFIPIAEQSGLISRIGRFTTEHAVRQLAKWKAEGKELRNISINYSCNQISDVGYVDFLKKLLKDCEIDPKYIGLEITEGLFMDNTWQAGNLFVQFKNMGVQILMDDFGTGYSSLSYLTYIPVDVLKLDKSLVNAYLTDGKELFIRDVIALTHDLGKTMIIEGVEEKWQYESLRKFGADVIQGYYFSKPLPPDEAIDWSPDGKSR